MNLWSRVSPLLWEEAEIRAAEPTPRPGAAGAPEYLRKAVRFTVVGFSAMIFTGQVAGIRLTARVDADPTYCVRQSQLCKEACPPNGDAHASCIKFCNDQRKACELRSP